MKAISDNTMNDERVEKKFSFLRLSLIVSSLIAHLILAPEAQATPLVGDLSNYRISIDSGFNGTRIFLFGARNDNGDIVVVVRGPGKDYIVRKKESIGGIWVNRERMKFRGMPDFYAIATSKPLTEIAQANIFRGLNIGEENIVPAGGGAFSQAFLRFQHVRKLYVQQPEPVTFMGETLFKTTIEFPDNIPAGNYTAEIYLISDGEIVGMQSTPITVSKSGLDAFLYMYAHEFPLFYGFSAVVMALGVGWFAGRIFEKA